MKLNCGPESIVKAVERELRLVNWHTFFAVWPRRVGHNDCRFMETVMRKGYWHEDDGRDYATPGCWWTWEYMSMQKYKEMNVQ